MKKQIKKSKRLEFTQATINKVDKLAKSQGTCFKLLAEKVICELVTTKSN